MLALRYKERTFAVPKEVTAVGRSSGCGFQISHYMVSRKHCSVQQTPDGIRVADLKSSNGTFINGRPVHRENCHATDGDLIQLGTLELAVVDVTSVNQTTGEDLGRDAEHDELPTMMYNAATRRR